MRENYWTSVKFIWFTYCQQLNNSWEGLSWSNLSVCISICVRRPASRWTKKIHPVDIFKDIYVYARITSTLGNYVIFLFCTLVKKWKKQPFFYLNHTGNLGSFFSQVLNLITSNLALCAKCLFLGVAISLWFIFSIWINGTEAYMESFNFSWFLDTRKELAIGK